MISAVMIALLTVHAQLYYASVEGAHACTPTTVVTFNAALKALSPLYESRRTRIAEAVKETDADVVCLQEVSYEEDVVELLKNLQCEYPYSWSFLHSCQFTVNEVFNAVHRPKPEKKLFPCSEVGYCSFKHCAALNCSSASDSLALTKCIIQNCTTELYALSGDCLACLFSSVASLEIADKKCGQGGNFTRFQGEGLMILSKKPILSPRKFQFYPNIKQGLPKGFLEVDVHGVGKVMCTHLTADLSYLGLDYAELQLAQSEGITSYVEQQTREVDRIIRRYERMNVILAGDLNTGPALPSQNVTAEVQKNYDTLTANGFGSPYVDMDGKCTFCGDNMIAHPPDIAIDHVLLRGFEASEAKRILENGTNPVSDHYGVCVTLCPVEE